MIFRHLTGLLRKYGRISKGALERSLSTNLREIHPRIRAPPPNSRVNVVVTLDPNKFAEMKQERLQVWIGSQSFIHPYIALHNQSEPVRARLFFDRSKDFSYFPPDTKAFLYYTIPPGGPRIAGELRLRVASSDDPASFESGSDLLGLNGSPWSRSLFILSKHCIPLYEMLRKEGHVPDDLHAVLSTFPPKSRIETQRLYSLNDTFTVDFSFYKRSLSVITEQGIETIRFIGMFSEARPTSCSPYTGSALVRFERSTLPNHKGTRTVVLRFLRIITPVKCVKPLYDGHIVQPKEGELHRRYPTSMQAIKKKVDPNSLVWSVNIDKQKGPASIIHGLRLLWDA